MFNKCTTLPNYSCNVNVGNHYTLMIGHIWKCWERKVSIDSRDEIANIYAKRQEISSYNERPLLSVCMDSEQAEPREGYSQARSHSACWLMPLWPSHMELASLCIDRNEAVIRTEWQGAFHLWRGKIFCVKISRQSSNFLCVHSLSWTHFAW